MSEIYLPSYIATSESIGKLIFSNPNQDLVVIRVRNYRLLETLISNAELNKIILYIENKISEFCITHALADFNVISLRDYIFITNPNNLIEHITQLKKYLNYLSMPVYISLQMLGRTGHVANVLPLLIQRLEYYDGYSPVYNNPGNDMIIKEYHLLNLLKKALDNKTASFAYQPIINSIDGSTAYRECLMRIPDENGKWISAGPAIILAEKYGLIDVVDEAVIDMAAHELESASDIVISINISNIGILDDELLNKITTVFAKTEIANRLIIEITETSVNDDVGKTIHFIDTIRALGIRIAIDDFGVGVTSFKQLCAIKFDIIKIDGSLIQDIATNPYHSFIVESVVQLSKKIGAQTVAEFVENGEVAKKLIDLKIDFMQGHFFAHPQNFRSWNK